MTTEITDVINSQKFGTYLIQRLKTITTVSYGTNRATGLDIIDVEVSGLLN